MSRSELSEPVSESSRLARLRAQVIDQSRQEPALTRAQVSLQNRVVMAVALLVPLLIFGALGGARLAPRPDRLVLQTAVASGILAVMAAVVGVSRGRSMLGRPHRLLPLVLLTPIALFARRACWPALSIRTCWLSGMAGPVYAVSGLSQRARARASARPYGAAAPIRCTRV